MPNHTELSPDSDRAASVPEFFGLKCCWCLFALLCLCTCSLWPELPSVSIRHFRSFKDHYADYRDLTGTPTFTYTPHPSSIPPCPLSSSGAQSSQLTRLCSALWRSFWNSLEGSHTHSTSKEYACSFFWSWTEEKGAENSCKHRCFNINLKSLWLELYCVSISHFDLD